MASRTHRAERRTEALSRERIVEAAGELHEATGPGAIYWHVANKGELLDAATDAVVADALATRPADAPDASPQDRIRAVALGLFDAIDEHPWVAAQLSASSWQTTRPRIFESIGRQVRALGVPQDDWFTVASVLMQYVLGAAAQNAANGAKARTLATMDRSELLDTVATAWEELDPDEYSFTRTIGDQMREHDDREQFLAGIDLALAGITARHLPAP